MSRLTWFGASVVWTVLVGVGFRALLGYAGAAGLEAAAPLHFPVESRVARVAGRGTLLMLVHSRCPCSRASLAELERVLARTGDRVAARALFVGPTDGDVRAQAARIAGLQIVDEADGEARRFGARTSGQVLYYDAAGALRFSGGITSARGHEGGSAARDLLEDVIRSDGSSSAGSTGNQGSTTSGRARVFGCSLFAQGA